MSRSDGPYSMLSRSGTSRAAEGGRRCRQRGLDLAGRGPDEALVRSRFQEHGRAMLAYATQLTRDRAAAEDVVQEALVRAWRHPDSLANGKGSVRGWLLTVIRNIVVDQVRARSRRPP